MMGGTEMEMIDKDLQRQLKSLKLHYTAENLESMCESLKGKSFREMMAHLVTLEAVERKSRSLERLMAAARLGRYKTMDQFDWSHPEEIPQSKVELLLNSDLVERNKNLILIGTQGLGKSMIAKNIGARAVYQGHSVRFITASKLVSDLLAAGHLLESKLRSYSRVHLLIIDELGYLSYQDKAADMLFEIISRRYERLPTVLTTNLGFKDWPTVFPGAACVSAILDRLIHHCDIVQIKGPSYRKREASGGVK
jgi:DNA replication protein DnaC